MYWKLANEKEQTKWLVTFCRDGTRHDFQGIDYEGHTRWTRKDDNYEVNTG